MDKQPEMDVLNVTIQELLNSIKSQSQKTLVAIRQRKSEEIVWILWGDFFVNLKRQLEKAIWDMNMQHVKWIYAYLQNRNQLLSLHLETRVGKVHAKKSLNKSANLLIGLLAKTVKARNPCEVCNMVDQHLLKLASGECDIVIGKEILVSDYPEKYKYKEPAMVLAPQSKSSTPN